MSGLGFTQGMNKKVAARLGVMGGTFDPVHLGHLVAASEALHTFDLDRVLFVPAGQPWQREHYSSAEDRYLMTVLAAETHQSFAVSRAEIDRRGATYTADTLQELSDVYPGAELKFIAGADAVLNLGTWKGLERVADLAEVVAVTRPGFDLSGLKIGENWPRVIVLEMPGIGVSATDIRERVRAERPVDYLLPAQVISYIRERGLYVGASDG